MQDTAKINLPAHSQTLYTGQACKTIIHGAAEMRDMLNSSFPARAPYPYVDLYRLDQTGKPMPARCLMNAGPGESSRTRFGGGA